MAELSVQIGADIKDLLKKLDLTEKQLKKLESISAKSGKKIGSVGTTAAKGIDKFGKSTVNALPATQEFSRVIQDAPFGIQGVGNNIQQLTANFGHLSKQAGGSSKALKAMVSSLAGPAGMLLAVSAITTLLTVYSDELFNSKNETNELVEATKEFAGSANAELSTLQSLISVAKDENKSKQERNKALTLAKEKTDGYLDSLTLENINTEKSTALTDKYSEALIRQAKIKGLQTRISDLFTKKYDAENKSITEQIGFLGKTWSILKNGGNALNASIDATNKGLSNQAEEVAKVGGEIATVEQQLKDLISEDISLGGVFSDTKKAGGGKGSRIKIKAAIELETPEEARGKFNKFAEGAIGVLKDSFGVKSKDLGASLIQVADLPPLKIPVTLDTEKIEADISSVGNFISESFATLGETLGDIFSGVADGGSIFEGLMKTVSSFMAQLGKSLIATGVAAIAFKKLLANPVAAIAAGTALVALSSIVANQFKEGASFAKGGFSNDDNIAYLNRNELILRPQEQAALWNALRGKNLGTVSGNVGGDYTTTTRQVIEGDKLILVTERAQRRKGRIG